MQTAGASESDVWEGLNKDEVRSCCSAAETRESKLSWWAWEGASLAKMEKSRT